MEQTVSYIDDDAPDHFQRRGRWVGREPRRQSYHRLDISLAVFLIADRAQNLREIFHVNPAVATAIEPLGREHVFARTQEIFFNPFDAGRRNKAFWESPPQSHSLCR
jgi:hypothetical protein